MWRTLYFHVIGVFSCGAFFFSFVSSSLACVIHSPKTWTFTFRFNTLALYGLPVSSISSGAMSSVSGSFINLSVSSSLWICIVSSDVNSWSVEAPQSIWKCLLWLLPIFQFYTHKSFTATLQQLRVPTNIRSDEDILRTPFVFVFKRLPQEILIKTNIFALLIRLQKASSRRLQDVIIKTNIFVLVIRLKDVFKTFSRRLQDIMERSCKKVFKRYS